MLLGCRIVCKLLVAAALLGIAEQKACYSLKLLSYRLTETPDYRFAMQFNKNQTLQSVTRVLVEVPVPMWHLVLVQHNNERTAAKGEPPKTLYNATYKVCELWRYIKRIRIFNNVAHMLFDNAQQGGGNGNMSLSCPMRVGTYVMTNIHVPADTGILKFMYWPNTIYTLFGTVYSQQPDKSLVLKCTYEINATVVKSC